MSWKTTWGSFGGSNLRARSLASENRWAEDWVPEYRSARTPVLEFGWGDVMIRPSRSWKDQTKYRKQWEKNVQETFCKNKKRSKN